jgi:hypothetical protein
VETANQRPIVVETLSDKPKVRPCLYINGVADVLICGLGPVLTGALPLARRGRCTVVLVYVCVVQLFHLHNFFSEGEADQLIANALKISEPSNRLKRSTTGQGPGRSSQQEACPGTRETKAWRHWSCSCRRVCCAACRGSPGHSPHQRERVGHDVAHGPASEAQVLRAAGH